MPERFTSDPQLSELRDRAAAELRGDILPFWERWAFDHDGWLVGSALDDLSIDEDVPRHSVIIARILWTFAAAAGAEQDVERRERWLVVGRKAFALLTGPCRDTASGGVFWSLDASQRPLSDRKQVYAQAVSRRGGNEESFEGFSGCEESQDGAGSFVELFGDGGQVGLVVGDRGGLGQVLADQAVGGLVGATFPR